MMTIPPGSSRDGANRAGIPVFWMKGIGSLSPADARRERDDRHGRFPEDRFTGGLAVHFHGVPDLYQAPETRIDPCVDDALSDSISRGADHRRGHPSLSAWGFFIIRRNGHPDHRPPPDPVFANPAFRSEWSAKPLRGGDGVLKITAELQASPMPAGTSATINATPNRRIFRRPTFFEVIFSL
jgi:hypothetical protein